MMTMMMLLLLLLLLIEFCVFDVFAHNGDTIVRTGAYARRRSRTVVLNRCSTEPQGFGEPAPGVRQRSSEI